MEGEENKKINIMKVVKKWDENDKLKLIRLYQLGYTFPEISVKMDRSRFSVESEMHLLRLQGRVGYRTSESEAAANERWLSFKPQSVEFENVVMTRPSDEGAEQAERAERKAITTDKATRTNTIFNEILENIRYTHDKKNDDYKDSYSDTMKRFGTKSGLVRIYDKFNRIENILDSEGKANFESAEDNLQDLATYAIMMLEYIKKGGNK